MPTKVLFAIVLALGWAPSPLVTARAADAPPLVGFATCDWGSDDCNPCVPDVPGAIAALRNRGDIMGFHMNDTPDVNPFDDHWQGVQRTMSGQGRYLVVSRSIETAATDIAFVVVEMASRNDDGLRFRSNRLAPTVSFEFTPPPPEDGVVGIMPHEARCDGGERDDQRCFTDAGCPGGTCRAYLHAGGIQLLGNVLAVPFEKGHPKSRVVLYDLTDPLHPGRLSNEIIHDTPTGISSEAGTATLGKLADGRFLLVIGRIDANILDFYVSTGTELRTTAFEHFDTWSEGELLTETGDSEFGNYQNLSLVHQCDRALYLVGTHQNSVTAEDFVDLFRLENRTDNVPDGGNDVVITKVVQQQLVCGYRGENHCSFDAAGGVYVDPEHRLFLYGTEFDNDGPVEGFPFCSGTGCSVKMEEFRPVPHGPCTRIKDAWVELYDDTVPDADRSIIIDFVDRDLENYSNYNSIDDFEDKASHALWCLPEGATHRLWENRDSCGGDALDLVGTGQVEEIGNLDDRGFGDDASCSEWRGGPFADAGDDVVAACAAPFATPVQLDGTGSAVLVGTASFLWEASGIAFDDPTSSTPIGQFPLGTTTVTLTVSDGSVSVTDTVDVSVFDTAPPGGPCDLPLELRRARLRQGQSRGRTLRGAIVLRGSIPPGRARVVDFAPVQGVAVRVLDGLALDQRFTFPAADCRARADGDVMCRSQGGDWRARFTALPGGRLDFDLRFDPVAIARPFGPPVTLVLTAPPGDPTAIDRVGAIADCRVTGNGMICH